MRFFERLFTIPSVTKIISNKLTSNIKGTIAIVRFYTLKPKNRAIISRLITRLNDLFFPMSAPYVKKGKYEDREPVQDLRSPGPDQAEVQDLQGNIDINGI